jgi:hypothetical protein
MNWTNKNGLPDSVFRAIANDPYDPQGSDYTTTTLHKPPLIVRLERDNAGLLEQDVADNIYSMIGQIGHGIIERASKGEYVEKRFFTEVSGKKISGQVDWIDDPVNELVDYKFTSRRVYEDGVKQEWIAQASVNRFLCWRNGVEIKGAKYVAILRDWSKRQAAIKDGYPPKQVLVFDVPLWPLWKTQAWIEERIALFERPVEDQEICTEEERWVWSGEDIRCDYYCNVRKFCPYRCKDSI